MSCGCRELAVCGGARLSRCTYEGILVGALLHRLRRMDAFRVEKERKLLAREGIEWLRFKSVSLLL